MIRRMVNDSAMSGKSDIQHGGKPAEGVDEVHFMDKMRVEIAIRNRQEMKGNICMFYSFMHAFQDIENIGCHGLIRDYIKYILQKKKYSYETFQPCS